MLTLTDLPSHLQQTATRRNLAAGQILFQQGDPTASIFWVESGRLKLVSFTEQQMITHYTVGSGESFAETALNFETYGCTAIAVQPSKVVGIPKQDFLDALRRSPTLSETYTLHLTQRFAAVKQLLELRSIRSARDRLLHYLNQHRQPGQSTVPLNFSLKALATELGLAPEVLSRTFKQLEADQILSRKKGSITFRDEWLNHLPY